MPKDENLTLLRQRSQERLKTLNREYALLQRLEYDFKLLLNSLVKYTPEQRHLELYQKTYLRLNEWIDEQQERTLEVVEIRRKLKDRLERLKKFREVR